MIQPLIRRAMKADFSFAKRPLWLVGHLIAVAAIVLFVALGLWQLSRHEDRSALDARLSDRLAAQPLDLTAARAMSPDEVDLRRVTVTGSYDRAAEVILQARSFNGRSGHNVLTPLVLADGVAVIVNRGWVPIDVEGPPVTGADPPAGELTLVGVARKTEERRGLGPVDPADGVLDRVSRVDIVRLALQTSYPLESFYLQLISTGAEGQFPLVLDAPAPGGGPPHLAYAVQWFAFAGVVLVGYPLLLRSTSRKRPSA